MMYVVVRDYQGEGSDVAEQARERQATLKQAMGAITGLAAYYVLDTGNGGLATITVVDDETAADESIKVAATWVREHFAQWAPSPPTIIRGEVIIDIAR